ncbi:MAG: hypothetical protein J6A15_08905, partial [Clostridia bacterium]|nr:hypothetical protein [Clostridia bacterium]
MNTKRKAIIVAIFVFLLCFPVSPFNTSNDAYAITSIPASELTTHKGSEVTGDDIVNTGRYLLGRGFTYNSVGTCTGFVTRILSYLEVGVKLVSRPAYRYDYCYSSTQWDKPNQWRYNAAWGPSDWLSQARSMVNDGTAKYIGVIPLSNPEKAQSLGIQNGDILITPEGSSSSGHVAIAYIDTDGRVKSFGATGGSVGMTVSEFKYITSGKQGDTYVYRIVESTSKLIVQFDVPNGYGSGTSIKLTNKGTGKEYNITTDANGFGELTPLEPGDYYVDVPVPPQGTLIPPRTEVHLEPGKEVTLEIDPVYPKGSTRLVKYDADNRGATLGDATLAGATFNLCAAEHILEGETQYYTKDQVVATVTTDANGNTPAVENLPVGHYYYVETSASEGFNINTNIVNLSINYVDANTAVIPESYGEIAESPIYGNIEITKKLGALDYDPEINLSGVQFKATLNSSPVQVYYSTTTDSTGVATFTNIPYGVYTIEECVVPNEAEKIDNFEVNITEHGKTYEYTKVDVSKDMKIEVYKQIKVNAGEQTDAVVQGAEFTVYRDAACTDKVCVIGPTDKTGYAISGTMRTGTYYLKETKFPEGIDPDATIAGENVTYRNKVYSITYNNASQGTELVTVSLTVQNEPKRNDIEIYKEIGKTSNTTQAPLDKCEFTATLKSSIGTDNVFSRKCTAETDANGYCIIEDLPYGDYVVEETKISPISLKCDNFDINIENDQKVQTTPYSKNIVDEPKVMQIKVRKVDANRTDSDAPDMTQGDGVLEGAIYQIYRYDPQTDDYTEAVYEITVDHKDSEGYWCAESEDLLVGKYMVKEKISRTEYDDNNNAINYSYAEGYLADPEAYYFEQQPDLQTVKRTYHVDTSKEEVIRGSVQIMKYDDNLNASEEATSEGAELRLTLNSNPEIYYDLVINKYGYGEFVEEDSRTTYYPYTIPYGEYTITELKESNKGENTSFFVQPEGVTIEKQGQEEYRIEADIPVEMYLQIQKTDKDTGAKVNIAGARFKVWNCETEEWVSQITYPSGEYISEFEVKEDGLLTLPHKLEAGEYIVYETKAPEGYYLEEAWRIPANQADIGNAEKGGKLVKIDKAAMGIVQNTPANRLDLYYTVKMPNEPLKGKLEIFKTGEMLTDYSVSATEYGEKYTPVYSLKGLEGVTYDIIAAQDIKSPDGKETYVKEGTIVDTITTGEDGVATTKDLYLGEYEIVETVTPLGYVTDTDIENVVLENTDTLKRIEVTEKSLTNVRQKLQLSLIKEYAEMEYTSENDAERYAVFGVYSNQNIKNTEGTVVIEKDALVDVIKIEGEETNITSTIDLPSGEYYVKELEASYPYTTSDEVRNITLAHTNTTQEYVTFMGEKVVNEYEKGSLSVVKLSTSSTEGLTLKGDKVDTAALDEKVYKMLNEIKGLTEAELIEYFKENDIKFVPGAKYKIYIDAECTKPLKEKVGDEYKEVELVTTSTGMIKLENIPLGKYYVKEIEAPKGYELSEEAVEFELTKNDKDTMVYRALIEEATKSPMITKTDIFTGEVIPDCTFEIRDEEGNVLLHSITNEKGEGYIPLDLFEDGKTYTYTEIDAPEIYNLNTESHEFVAKFDEEGNWLTEKVAVENTRKESTVTFEKLDFADSTPIPNCKFELRSLETDFVVEGVTDENGIYVFENIPYGKYTYTELEAPEEYIIDTEAHEVTID